MKFTEFRATIKRPLFSRVDVDVSRIGVYNSQLTRWVREGRLALVARGLYAFVDSLDQIDPYTVACTLYEPSYISMECALHDYSLMPDVPQVATLITSNTTRRRNTSFGRSVYKHVKPALFFGYTRVKTLSGSYLMAEPEKALLDYLYFYHDTIRTEGDVVELRINAEEFVSRINQEKLLAYAARFAHTGVSRALILIQNHVTTS